MAALRLSLVAACIACALGSTAATPARADDVSPSDVGAGDPLPPGYHRETRMRTDVVLTGALVFGIPYALSALAAAASPESRRMLVPVAGPALQLSADSHSNGEPISAAVTVPASTFLLGMDTVLQAIGVVTLLVGLASERSVLVRDVSVTLRPTPMRLGEDGHGIGLTGAF